MINERRKPPWLMTLSQAEAIECFAEAYGFTVADFIESVLCEVYRGKDWRGLEGKLTKQAEWLLGGLPAEASPYYERFVTWSENPFGRGLGLSAIPIDTFIAEAIPRFLAATGRLKAFT